MTGQAATDDTALLELAINGVSEAIIRYTEREFHAADDTTRTFEYLPHERGYLDLAPYELRTIDTVTIGGEAVTLSAGAGGGGYVPLPRNQTREGTYTYLTLRGFYSIGSTDAIYAPLLATRDVVIVGDWGMAAVPADVELACLIAVSDLYRNPEQVSTRGSGDFSITELATSPGSDESLPPGARRLLDPFVRPKVG